jgi:hypothetical protein
MIIAGLDSIRGREGQPPRGGKFLINETAIVFFGWGVQHQDVKLPGLNFEDHHQGNAVAGSFVEQRVDIRGHRGFSDDWVRSLWSRVRLEPELSFLREWPLYYQNRLIV